MSADAKRFFDGYTQLENKENDGKADESFSLLSQKVEVNTKVVVNISTQMCFNRTKTHLFGGSEFLLQMFDGLFCHSDLPQGVFVGQLLALLPLPLLQLSHSHPQLVHLGRSRY